MPSTTIPDALRSAIKTHANRPLLTDSDGTLSFAQVSQHADAIAGALHAAGVRPGGRVLVSMTASRWTWATFWAIWSLGAVPVAIGDLSGMQLRQTIRRAAAAAHVMNADRLDRIAEAHADGPGVPLFTDIDAGPGATALAALPPGEAPPHRAQPDDVASIVFSSGTTGTPKGIVHTHRSLLAASENTARSFGLEAGERALSVNQIYHVWSQVAVILTGSLRGTHTILTTFSYPDTVRLIARERVALMHAPPPVLSALAAQSVTSDDLSTLRRIITGGAPANVSAIQQIIDDHPQIQVRNGYGCSEYILATMDAPTDAPTPPGSSGAIVPGVDVRILSPGPDGVGEIAVRAPSMMEGYLDDQETTDAAFDGDYFRTGDLGRFVGGQLFVSGRSKDIVIVNGENVVPTEVETAANAFPGVMKSAAYGRAHPSTGEAIEIKVVPVDGTEIDQVDFLKYLRANLSRNKVPRSVEIVDAIAETATGKIIR